MSNRNLLLSSGKQTISVTLKVINSSGNAIKNARIEIQELGSFTTDNNGKVSLEGLLENEIYRVTISAPGYTSISNRFATNTDPVQEYTFVLQVALPSVETILVTREPEYQSFVLTILNGVTVLKVLSAYFIEISEYIGNMSLHNIDNNKYWFFYDFNDDSAPLTYYVGVTPPLIKTYNLWLYGDWNGGDTTFSYSSSINSITPNVTDY